MTVEYKRNLLTINTTARNEFPFLYLDETNPTVNVDITNGGGFSGQLHLKEILFISC